MQWSHQRLEARIALAALTLAATAALVLVRPSRRISADVLDLVPRDERQPELMLVRSLASEQGARTALFALDARGTGGRAQAALEAFCASLQHSAAFSEVVDLQDSDYRASIGKELFRERLNVLLPAWLAAHRRAYEASGSRQPWPDWLAANAARELRAFLDRPEALGFQDMVPSDPLLLVPGLVDSVRDMEPAAARTGAPRLVWARLSASPFQEAGQLPVLAAVGQALRSARLADPSATLRWTSLGRFAAASRARIEGELSTLNVLSLAAVLAVAAACLKSPWRAANLLPVVAGAVLFAWTVTLLAFPHVHVLVFVVGSLLAGVAIDYGFYVYLQPPDWPGEPYSGKAGRLIRPMLSSALTAILGFSLLLLSELPLIRQLGVFVSAGLLGAVAFSFIWFAQVENPFMETRAFARFRPRPGAGARRLSRVTLAIGACFGLAGISSLRWHDDIRELQVPTPDLLSEARDVRALFGDTDDRAVYVTHGASVQSARDSLERFIAWHQGAYPGAPINSAAQILPTSSEWRALAAAHEQLGDFPAILGRSLAREGFEPDSFAPFFSAWRAWAAAPLPGYDAMARSLAAGLRGPLGSILSVSPGECTLMSIAGHPADRDPPPELSTASASQLETLNRLFSRYRESALRLSVLGLCLVGLSVLVLYGPRRGIRIFAVPAGACLFAFGILGALGQPLNLFHLLGAFLGVCLSHNYAIFSAENEARHQEPPPSIRLSALCTAASFGVLTLSHIPVVASLGATVSLTVLSALAIVELKMLAGRAPAPGAAGET